MGISVEEPENRSLLMKAISSTSVCAARCLRNKGRVWLRWNRYQGRMEDWAKWEGWIWVLLYDEFIWVGTDQTPLKSMLYSLREGFNKKKATNLGFLPNFRGGGVRRGSYGPTPLTDIYFLLNTVLNALKHEISQKKFHHYNFPFWTSDIQRMTIVTIQINICWLKRKSDDSQT